MKTTTRPHRIFSSAHRRCGAVLLGLAMLLAAATAQAQSEAINTIRAWGTDGSTLGNFNNPTAIAVGLGGSVYVVDSANRRVQEFNETGSVLRAWHPGTGGNFQDTRSLAVDRKNRFIYIAENLSHRVAKYDLYGNLQTAWGTDGGGKGQFRSLIGVAVGTGSDTEIYTLDAYSSRVQVFNATGRLLREWLVQEKNKLIGDTTAIATGPGNEVFITSRSTHAVYRFKADGSLIAAWHTLKSYPYSISVNGIGVIMVADRTDPHVAIYYTDGLNIKNLSIWSTHNAIGGQGHTVTPLCVAFLRDDVGVCLDTGISTKANVVEFRVF